MFSFKSRPAAAAPAPAPAATESSTPKDPLRDQVKEWQRGLRQEMHQVERQMAEMQREEGKFKNELKRIGTKDPVIARALAKNIVLARKAFMRMSMTRAQINSVSMQLQEQYSMSRVAGTMGKSAGIMKSMATLVNAPTVMATMRTMNEEMVRAGIISEVMDDAMAAAEPEGLDAEADEEVDRVMSEIIASVKAPTAPRGQAAAAPAAAAAAAAPRRAAVPAGADDAEADAMVDRLRNL